MLPDGPLILGLLGAAASLARIWFPKDGEAQRPWRDWLATGFWIGVAALSKYQAALFCVGLGLAVLTSPTQRRWLTWPQPYAAGLLTADDLVTGAGLERRASLGLVSPSRLGEAR